MGEEYSSFGQISMLYAVCLTSGLHGPRVRLIMPKHFEDFDSVKERIIRFKWGTKRENLHFFFGQGEKNGQKQGHLLSTYMYTSV